MFCSECGTPAKGKFCGQCGQSLAPAAAGAVTAAGAVAAAAVLPDAVDWTHCADVEALLRIPELRERVQRYANMATKGMSGEDWLNAIGKLAGSPVPLSALAGLAGVVQSFYAKLGVGTGKTRTETLPLPVGRVLIGVLCSLARRGRKMIGVQRGEAGCVLIAELPFDLFAMAGTLHLAVRQVAAGTQLEIAAKIPGQYFDWGKSRRCLDETFEDLRVDPI